MTATALGSEQRRGVVPWLRAVVYGMALGLLAVLAQALGLWVAFAELGAWLTRVIGPVWVPMFAVALRVGWLWVRALRTRFGQGALGRPVRPELEKLAPIFPAFGLAGTVWGLDVAFGALDRDVFIERLPDLMAGLGAALISTLVGLGFQIATLLVAAYAPAWSLARVARSAERELYTLDGALLGEGESGLHALLEAIEAREPEALHLALDPALPGERRATLHARIWRSVDGAIPIRPPLPEALRA
jgi:hypothetical protein